MLRNLLSKKERLEIAKLSKDLPNEKQKCLLSTMIYAAFVEIRMLAGAGGSGNTEGVADLADTFHNLPLDLQGLSIWSPDFFRSRLVRYDKKYNSCNHNIFTKYLNEFDSIFPR